MPTTVCSVADQERGASPAAFPLTISHVGWISHRSDAPNSTKIRFRCIRAYTTSIGAQSAEFAQERVGGRRRRTQRGVSYHTSGENAILNAVAECQSASARRREASSCIGPVSGW